MSRLRSPTIFLFLTIVVKSCAFDSETYSDVYSSIALHDSSDSSHSPQKTTMRANESIEQFTSRLFKNYRRGHRPTSSSSQATVVDVNMFIVSISDVSVITMDYSVDFMLRQRWNDPRLQYDGYNKSISLNYMRRKLWFPDLFFRNAKNGHIHRITTPNYLIWLNSTGDILFSQKLSLKLSCPMKLFKFPMDTQYCKMEIGSYGYSLEELSFQWMYTDSQPQKNVQLNEELELNEFQRPELATGSCNKEYSTTGAFSCMYVEFVLERKFGFYLIYTFMPSILIIIISWMSFLIDFEAVPARISIGLLSVLALITQSAATLSNLPRVSYIKAIDVWLFTCLAFDVLSLVEFAFVNVLARTQQNNQFEDNLRKIFREEMSAMGRGSQEFDKETSRRGSSKSYHAGTNILMVSDRQLRPPSKRKQSFIQRQKHRLQAQMVDRFCMIAFPLSFLLFNIIYWCFFRLS